MDMSLREWLILVGAIILIGIVLDGYRRMARARRESLEMSRTMGGLSDDVDPDFNPELPTGKARVVPRDNTVDKESLTEPGQNERLDAADAASVDMAEHLSALRDEPDLNIRNEAPIPQPAPVKPEARPAAPQRPASTRPVANDISERLARPPKTATPGRKKESAVQQKPAAPDIEEIIVINVLSKDEGFDGHKLRQLVEACGMEFGEMSVFKRHEHGFGEGPVQFSMASAVEPGYFDLDTMDESLIPGVTFFLRLPGPDDNMKAFEYMLETAQCVVRNLNGEMKDERRSVFTQQTIEHCRQRIREFERRQQLAARI